jgi:hypothetical protein
MGGEDRPPDGKIKNGGDYPGPFFLVQHGPHYKKRRRLVKPFRSIALFQGDFIITPGLRP